MAKYELRLQARKLRAKGTSVREIAKQVGVSKGTASIWVRDIILSVEQLEKLNKSAEIKRDRGRFLGAFKQKQKWQEEMQQAKEDGKSILEDLSSRELLIAGLALYWGEGSKKKRTIEFCNSDPKMIQFLLVWLEASFDIHKADITCWVSINQIHQEREQRVKDYWAEITAIPLSQFTGTSFKKVVNKKVYENFEDHFGTLFFRVKSPARYYKRIIGLIDGLYQVVEEKFLQNNVLAG